MEISNIKRFNELWQRGEFTLPIVILIGGAAGTGKSTLADKLKNEIAACNVLGTPIIRTLLKMFIPYSKNYSLYKHTFDLLPSREKNIKSIKLLNENFREQSIPVNNVINEYIKFIISEKQNHIIEGSNIIPCEERREFKDVILIEFYMYIDSEEVHKIAFTGPTHNREINKSRFSNLRLLQKFVLEEAHRAGKQVFEMNESYEKILKFIDFEIGVALDKYKMK